MRVLLLAGLLGPSSLSATPAPLPRAAVLRARGAPPVFSRAPLAARLPLRALAPLPALPSPGAGLAVRRRAAPSVPPERPRAVPRAEAASAAAAAFWDGARTGAPARDLASRGGPSGRGADGLRTRRQLQRLEEAPRPPGGSFRFAVIGDAEPGPFWFLRILFRRGRDAFWGLLARADAEAPDFIVQLGDIVSGGKARNFARLLRRLAAAAPRAPFLTVPGNHDRAFWTGGRRYRSFFGPGDYSFERGGWKFVTVDSSAGRLTRAQLEWLDRELSPGGRTVVFTHMPPALLREWTDVGPLRGWSGFRRGAEEFMRLVSERGVARVYVGHVHALDALERDGVRYVLTGGGGSPLYPFPSGGPRAGERFHHYIVVEAGPGGLAETVRLSDGTSRPLPGRSRP